MSSKRRSRTTAPAGQPARIRQDDRGQHRSTRRAATTSASHSPGQPPPLCRSNSTAFRPSARRSNLWTRATGRLKDFTPDRSPRGHAEFSWLLPPGEYYARLTEPPASLVLIWDTSGSMGGRFRQLQQAVETFIDQVRPGERLQLIRFSDEVETLLPDFSCRPRPVEGGHTGQVLRQGWHTLLRCRRPGSQAPGGPAGQPRHRRDDRRRGHHQPP